MLYALAAILELIATLCDERGACTRDIVAKFVPITTAALFGSLCGVYTLDRPQESSLARPLKITKLIPHLESCPTWVFSNGICNHMQNISSVSVDVDGSYAFSSVYRWADDGACKVMGDVKGYESYIYGSYESEKWHEMA